MRVYTRIGYIAIVTQPHKKNALVLLCRSEAGLKIVPGLLFEPMQAEQSGSGGKTISPADGVKKSGWRSVLEYRGVYTGNGQNSFRCRVQQV